MRKPRITKLGQGAEVRAHYPIVHCNDCPVIRLPDKISRDILSHKNMVNLGQSSTHNGPNFPDYESGSVFGIILVTIGYR